MKNNHEEDKEPKGSYWMVNTRGTVVQSPMRGKKAQLRKKFGNYFRTKKLAMLAKERMSKLFTRIKKNEA